MGQAVLPSASDVLRFHPLLWTRDDVHDEAGVAIDLEIEPPIPIHPRFPNAFRFVVLLGAQNDGWVIAKKRSCL